jgi:diadenosine tetraphosphate (Ap4A) HIT family hydrolase
MSQKKDACIFCKILKQSEIDPTFIIKLNNGTLFLNFNQQYLGRCLYILNAHHETFHDLDNKTFINFNNEVREIGRILYKAFSPDLINYALLGNEVQHIHWHIIPRYKNDSNWGNPPWPHSEDKIAVEDSLKLTGFIRRKIIEEYRNSELENIDEQRSVYR